MVVDSARKTRSAQFRNNLIDVDSGRISAISSIFFFFVPHALEVIRSSLVVIKISQA